MSERQTGRTTLQMRAAPQGAVFVWCNEELFYPKALARDIGREDLKIISPRGIEWGQASRGRIPGIVVDHAAQLTSLQRIEVYEIERRNVALPK